MSKPLDTHRVNQVTERRRAAPNQRMGDQQNVGNQTLD